MRRLPDECVQPLELNRLIPDAKHIRGFGVDVVRERLLIPAGTGFLERNAGRVATALELRCSCTRKNIGIHASRLLVVPPRCAPVAKYCQLISNTMLLSLLAMPAAFAAEAWHRQVTVDIPAQRLDTALMQLARQRSANHVLRPLRFQI